MHRNTKQKKQTHIPGKNKVAWATWWGASQPLRDSTRTPHPGHGTFASSSSLSSAPGWTRCVPLAGVSSTRHLAAGGCGRWQPANWTFSAPGSLALRLKRRGFLTVLRSFADRSATVASLPGLGTAVVCKQCTTSTTRTGYIRSSRSVMVTQRHVSKKKFL
jgi:hypothetical protein